MESKVWRTVSSYSAKVQNLLLLQMRTKDTNTSSLVRLVLGFSYHWCSHPFGIKTNVMTTNILKAFAQHFFLPKQSREHLRTISITGVFLGGFIIHSLHVWKLFVFASSSGAALFTLPVSKQRNRRFSAKPRCHASWSTLYKMRTSLCAGRVLEYILLTLICFLLVRCIIVTVLVFFCFLICFAGLVMSFGWYFVFGQIRLVH